MGGSAEEDLADIVPSASSNHPHHHHSNTNNKSSTTTSQPLGVLNIPLPGVPDYDEGEQRVLSDVPIHSASSVIRASDVISDTKKQYVICSACDFPNELNAEVCDCCDKKLIEGLASRRSDSRRTSKTYACCAVCIYRLKYCWEHSSSEGEKAIPELPELKQNKCNLMCFGTDLMQRSLFLFPRDSRFRLSVRRLIANKWFNRLSVLLVISNCIFLAMDTPGHQDQDLTQVLETAEYIFSGLFVAEMLIKIIGLGFVLGASSFLRDWWNVLDFIIITTGLVSLFGVGSNGSALRGIRVLRPLRTITGAPGLRRLVVVFIRGLPILLNTVVLLFFVFILFGLMGMMIFTGKLHLHCANATTRAVRVGAVCGGSYNCEVGEICLDTGTNPNYGYLSFDNLGAAFLNIFTCTTLEGWTTTSYLVQDATHWVSAIYFVFLVLFCAFFVINLALAVIKSNFSRQRQKDGKTEIPATETVTAGLRAVDRVRGTKLQQQAFRLVQKPSFDYFFLVCIVLNTIMLATEHADQPSTLVDVTNYLNFFFTFCYLTEAGIKIFALRMRYFKVKFNCFDFCIAVIGFVDFVVFLSTIESQSQQKSDLTKVLQIFKLIRILRVVKLFKHFKSLRRLLHIVRLSLGSIAWVSALMGLFIFMYGLMGMQWFGGKFVFDGKTPRANFDNIGVACLTVFQLLTLEGWTEVMYNGMRATNPAAAIFFISWIVIGVYVLLNMFFAVLLENFEREHAVRGEQQRETLKKHGIIGFLKKSLERGKTLFNQKKSITGAQPDSQKSDSLVQTKQLSCFEHFRIFCACRSRCTSRVEFDLYMEEFSEKKKLKVPASVFQQGDDNEMKRAESTNKAENINLLRSLRAGDYPTPTQVAIDIELKREEMVVLPSGAKRNKRRSKATARNKQRSAATIEQELNELKNVASKPSFDVLNRMDTLSKLHKKQNSVVKNVISHYHFLANHDWFTTLGNVVTHKIMNGIIFFFIFCSSVLLALESPNMSAELSNVLEVCDFVFTTLFLIEMVLKMAIFGIWGVPGTYLADPWNRLDGIIVLTSMMSILVQQMTSSVNVAYVVTLRALRILRPLRMVVRNKGMRLVVNALLHTIPSMSNVLIVMAMNYVFFSIVAVQLWAGKLWRCNFYPPTSAVAVVGKIDCVAKGGVWENANKNFDNVFAACLTLFSVSTLEGFLEIMHGTMDSVGIDLQPVVNSSFEMCLYFVFFIVISSFFLNGLFVGVVFDTFVRLRDENSGFLLMNTYEKEEVLAEGIVSKARPKRVILPPNKRIRAEIHRIVSHHVFEKIITGCILLNVLIMSLAHEGQSPEFTIFIEVSDWVFFSIFALEAVLKLFAFFPRNYFLDKWNIFDFTVVMLSVTEKCLESFFGNQFNVSSIRTLKVFRVTRLFRLVRALRSINTLLGTLIASLPALVNVGTVLGLFYFVSSVLAVNLFGKINTGKCINRHANFNTFPKAVFTLLRVSTGEDWDCLMYDCMDPKNGGFSAAFVFFISFIVLVWFITLNLFIAIIVDNFSDIRFADKSQDRSGISRMLTGERVAIDKEMCQAFITLWSKYDPHVTHFVDCAHLRELLLALPPPLGCGPLASLPQTMLRTWGLHVHQNAVTKQLQVNFTETLLVLSRTMSQIYVPSPANSLLQEETRAALEAKLPPAPKDSVMVAPMYLIVAAFDRNRKKRAPQPSKSEMATLLPKLLPPSTEEQVRDAPTQPLFEHQNNQAVQQVDSKAAPTGPSTGPPEAEEQPLVSAMLPVLPSETEAEKQPPVVNILPVLPPVSAPNPESKYTGEIRKKTQTQ